MADCGPSSFALGYTECSPATGLASSQAEENVGRHPSSALLANTPGPVPSDAVRCCRYEAQITQLTQQAFNMESTALTTENLRNTMATVDAMQIANKELKRQYGKVDVDKIDVRVSTPAFHVAGMQY